MRSDYICAGLGVVLLAMAPGCNPAKQQATDAGREKQVAEGVPDAKGCLNPPKDMEGPAGAVYHFLAAFRSGDDTTSEAMLTDLARKQIKEHGLVVAPPANDSVQFEIGDVEMLGVDGARVKAQWSDVKDGKRCTDETIWMLRKEAPGWRVAGMAATVFPGEPPILLDFENLEETQAKRAKLIEEIARRDVQSREGPAATTQEGGEEAAHSQAAAGASSSSTEAVAQPRSSTPSTQLEANAVGGNGQPDPRLSPAPERRSDVPTGGSQGRSTIDPSNGGSSSALQQAERPAEAAVR
jgi:hypothetical protein